ncbi:MAG: glycoside hydrolase family 31 protein [Sphaerochaetaceae bacterium]|nr:glycoside hydrolase family 31 protein [Sphaerochaetaceae bacterium]
MEPKEALKAFLKLSEKPALPPEWAFGVWMSANRWNSQSDLLEQAGLARKYGMSATVMVAEAWSDEKTFYLWNKGKWDSSDRMVEELSENGIHLILWQVPVFKYPEDGNTSEQLDHDNQTAIHDRLCLFTKDGKPYRIPKGHWFAGSLVPDFTNPSTAKWWFQKRAHLLDSGISGFKTDGGEFIYRDDVVAFNGQDGRTLKNLYAFYYVKAYSQFIGKDRVLFSRAGFTGANAYSLYWAGDQLSQWSELKSVLNAGLNAALSGVFFWGFDIAGFSGPMPSEQLYMRAFALAVFVPIMQWHSEPSGGQFKDIQKNDVMINDRSPWNMTAITGSPSIMDRCRHLYSARNHLRPYIVTEASCCVSSSEPLMRPLLLDFPDDICAIEQDEEYMFGRDILVAPIVCEDRDSRPVYIPRGEWISCTGEKVSGPVHLTASVPEGKIAVWFRGNPSSGFDFSEVMKDIGCD